MGFTGLLLSLIGIYRVIMGFYWLSLSRRVAHLFFYFWDSHAFFLALSFRFFFHLVFAKFSPFLSVSLKDNRFFLNRCATFLKSLATIFLAKMSAS